MAGVIEQVVRLKDEASATLRTVSAAAEAAGEDVDQLAVDTKQVGDAMREAKTPAASLATEMGRLSHVTEAHHQKVVQLSSSSSGLRQVTRNLGYQIGDVIQTIQAGGNPMQAMIVQATDIAFQFDLATVATKAWNLAASPLGLGLAGVAATVAIVANQISAANDRIDQHIGKLDKATEAAARLARSEAALGTASTDVAGFAADLEIQTALLRGEIDEADVMAGKLGSGLADKLRPQMLAAAQAATENAVQIERLQNALAGTGLGAEKRADSARALGEAMARQAELSANLTSLQSQYERGRLAIDSYTDAVTAQAAADREAAAASKEQAAALKDHTDARMRLIQGAAAGEFSRRVMEGAPGSSDFGFTTDQMGRMFSAAFQAAASDGQTQSRLSMLFGIAMGRVGTGVNAALGAITNPMGTLAALGPQGAALAQTLSMLESVGREGNERVVRRLEEMSANIVQGAAQLPELFLMLIDRLPTAIGEAVAKAISGIFQKDPGEIGKSLLNAQLNILTGGLWSVGKGLARGAGADLPDWMQSGGGSNARTASAMLRRPSMGFEGSGRPSLTINGFVSTDVMDSLTRQADADFSAWGVGRGRRAALGG